MAMYLGTNRVAVTNEGGGSSEFSTATLTVMNVGSDYSSFSLELINVDRNTTSESQRFSQYLNTSNLAPNASEDFEIVLFDGMSNGVYLSNLQGSEGAIEWHDRLCYFLGDATIRLAVGGED